MKFAICNELWRDRPIEDIFRTAAKLGYKGVEVAPFTLGESVDAISAERRKQIRRAAADAGVIIVGLHWLFVSPKGLHLTTPDKHTWLRSVDYLKSLVNFCGDLGGDVMVFGSPKQRS
jgi:sugar phosphate isomerase/epimerase